MADPRPWPRKPSPLADIGALSHNDTVPDCDKCELLSICAGPGLLAPTPPCVIYKSVDEWESSIKIEPS